MTQTKSAGPRTIYKAVKILRAFSRETPELGVRNLAEKVDMPKSTVHRLLVALEQEGIVEQNATTGQYRLGLELMILAGRAMSSLDVRRAALASMRNLSDRWGETVDLDVLRGAEIIIIEELPGQHLLTTGGYWARQMPAHCTSTGKVLLAYAGREYVEKHLPVELPQMTVNTITSRQALMEQLAEVRRQGYARSWGESAEHVYAMAVPIRDRMGDIVAAMSISGPAARIDEQTASEMIQALKEASTRVSANLGYADDLGY